MNRNRSLVLVLAISLGWMSAAFAHTNTNAWAIGKTDRYVQAIGNNDGKLIRKTREYRQAMAAKRKANPNCEVTGLKPSFWGRNPDIHHYVPVEINITLACDTNNMITLARDIHFLLGHLGNWQDHNVNLNATKVAVWIAVAENGKSRKGNNKLLLKLHALIEPYVVAEEND